MTKPRPYCDGNDLHPFAKRHAITPILVAICCMAIAALALGVM